MSPPLVRFGPGLAPGTTAPDESRTVPASDPVTCAEAEALRKTAKLRHENHVRSRRLGANDIARPPVFQESIPKIRTPHRSPAKHSSPFTRRRTDCVREDTREVALIGEAAV